MDKLLTQKDVAERWQLTVRAIENCRKEGVITQVKGVPGIRFNLQQIEELENVKLERFSPVARKRMEREIEILKKENEILNQIMGNILGEASKIISLKKAE